MRYKRNSLDDVKKKLLSGESLLWGKHLDHAKGEIVLNSPESRRLFEYLYSLSPNEVEEPTDTVFDQLVKVWRGEGDPANSSANVASVLPDKETWKLHKLQTYGFGGLNQFEGPVFGVDFNQKSWCIEGQNGSGKTSLTSAIIWALTGQIVREHSGLTNDCGERKTGVFQDSCRLNCKFMPPYSCPYSCPYS
ncbi:MAG: hypothetical protein COA42_02880, partial [Alteromonadaceae bacterium]